MRPRFLTFFSTRFICSAATVVALSGFGLDASAQGPYEFSLVADSSTPQFSGNAFGGYPSINDAGTVAFAVDRVGAFRAEEGKAPVMVGASSTGGVSINRLGEIVARRYVGNDGTSELYKVAPDGTDKVLVRTDAEFRGFGFPHLSPTGTAVFWARKYPISPEQRGIFTSNGDGPPALLVNNFGEFNIFGLEPTINSSGAVAFTASKDTVNNVLDEGGLYLARNGAITPVFTAAGTPLRALDGSPYLNEPGQIALMAYEDNTGEPAIAVVNQDGSGLRVLASAGGIGPPGAYSMFDPPIINDLGTVAFYANIDTGGRGVYTGPDPTVDKLVEVGDTLFGSEVTNVVFRRGLNNRNEFAFYVKLADGRSGIAKARPATSLATPELEKVGNTATLSLPSYSNRDYQLEVQDPGTGAYLPLGERKRGVTGTAVTFTDTTATSSVRLYRVRILPIW